MDSEDFSNNQEENVYDIPAVEDVEEEENVFESESHGVETIYPAADDEIFYQAHEPEPFSSILPEPEAQEDALAIFNKQWQIKLDAKRATEFELEKAARTKAQADYSNWTTQRDIRLNAKKETNRTEENVVMEAVNSEAENLKTWDRVGKLIDAADSADAKGSDTGRMRKLFIQLKNEPLEVTRAASAVVAAN